MFEPSVEYKFRMKFIISGVQKIHILKNVENQNILSM